MVPVSHMKLRISKFSFCPPMMYCSSVTNGKLCINLNKCKNIGKISDHQQSWGYEDGPWKGPGPPPLVAADFLKFFLISVLLALLVLMTT